MKRPSLKADLPAEFDIEGHRGCRGLLPENTVPAFLKALELGVDTLEMDVVITKDHQVLVSHDPYMSHEFCLDPKGKTIPLEEENSHVIYRMDYKTVSRYDCGLKPHPRFPVQKKIPVNKPLLKEVIDVSEKFQKEHRCVTGYNIEIKSTPEGDTIFHPGPEEFTDLLMTVLWEKKIEKKTIVQCFDLRPLQYLHRNYPGMTLSYLIENTHTPEENIAALGFIPEIYSPDYSLVDDHLIRYAEKNNMKIIPWTVNDLDTIIRLQRMGVHGIITDYPDLLLN
ncbi:MAG: glycerophosphodiester phosphodiesterase family protein [Cytophagaceae bacterium]